MDTNAQGELAPTGGGDSIPLVSRVMTVGRRESCDICLKFPNISGLHCELSFRDGYWFIRDMGSSNGIKVNGSRALQRALRPGDEVSIANRKFVINYEISAAGQAALEKILSQEEGLRSRSLLEKAGLAKPKSYDDE